MIAREIPRENEKYWQQIVKIPIEVLVYGDLYPCIQNASLLNNYFIHIEEESVRKTSQFYSYQNLRMKILTIPNHRDDNRLPYFRE